MSRRQFVQRSAAVAGAVQLLAGAHAGAAAQGEPAVKPADAEAAAAAAEVPTQLTWLEDGLGPAGGTTWGVPWSRGAMPRGQTFALKAADGHAVPVQTWPLAFWPDGSLKWTAHAMAGRADGIQWHAPLLLAPGEPAAPQRPVTVREREGVVEADTGAIRCEIPRKGTSVIESVERAGQSSLRAGQLVCLRQDTPDAGESGAPVRRETFLGTVERVTVEQSGPVRAVVRVEGKHVRESDGRAWLPFVVRLYFYAGADSIRLVHTFVFDGDEHKDYIAGLGVRFAVPMRDRLQDRHVRFVAGSGMWAEAVRTLTGLRRNAGEVARRAQVEGKPTPPDDELPSGVRGRLDKVPAWGDFTLSQLSCDGFEIRKRTKEGHAWIRAGAGQRADGVAYVGGVSGGVAFGLRDFWQRFPAQIDVRGAAGDRAEVTMWMYSPAAPAMDLRFYHDGMGLDTHQKQLEALEITYEDYEPGFGTPHGIARTSEMMLWALPSTPSRESLSAIARAVQAPPALVCAPARYHGAGVFGKWSLPDNSTSLKKRIEDQLDFLFDFYEQQREQHRWYGFWDYGDVMHTYDPDRHTWRYDVGGYAWDNSELSPDLWLWYSFLRGGRADVFRFAEAMTRHTGEVDVYHLGRFAGLGTRHNVQHWGCSAKQLRVSTAAYRRFFYYLTADERVGDLMRELLEADRKLREVDPLRKVRREPFTPKPRAIGVSFGLDWGSLAAAWLTEWERTGDAKWRDKLLAGMRSIGDMPHGFFTAGATFDPETGEFTDNKRGDVDASHLSSLFGLPEIAIELIQLLGDDAPGFERAWTQYGELYNGSDEAREKALGRRLSRLSQTGAHSKLTAYAAWRRKDAELAKRAWREFLSERSWPRRWYERETIPVAGSAVLNPVDEAPWVSTNETSQWALAAIANLALAADAMPAELP